MTCSGRGTSIESMKPQRVGSKSSLTTPTSTSSLVKKAVAGVIAVVVGLLVLQWVLAIALGLLKWVLVGAVVVGVLTLIFGRGSRD